MLYLYTEVCKRYKEAQHKANIAVLRDCYVEWFEAPGGEKSYKALVDIIVNSMILLGSVNGKYITFGEVVKAEEDIAPAFKVQAYIDAIANNSISVTKGTLKIIDLCYRQAMFMGDLSLAKITKMTEEAIEGI